MESGCASVRDKDTEPIMMTFAEVQELERLRQEKRHLENIIECLKDEITKADKRIAEIHEAAKRVHDAVTELDCLICL